MTGELIRNNRKQKVESRKWKSPNQNQKAEIAASTTQIGKAEDKNPF
jgi:hypothetical protein